MFASWTGEAWPCGHRRDQDQGYASKHKAMSYKRMNETEARLKQEIDALLAAAEQTDAEEDAQHGKDRHGDELPIELQRRESGCRRSEKPRLLWSRKLKKRRAAMRRDRAEAGRTRTRRASHGQEEAWPQAESARSRAGQARRHSATQLRRSGEPYHAGRSHKGSFVQGYNAQIAAIVEPVFDRSKNSVVFAASACVANRMFAASGDWCARQQSAEAVQGRLGSGNGINARKGESYLKLYTRLAVSCQLDYCTASHSEKPAMQAARIRLGKALCPTDS